MNVQPEILSIGAASIVFVALIIIQIAVKGLIEEFIKFMKSDKSRKDVTHEKA